MPGSPPGVEKALDPLESRAKPETRARLCARPAKIYALALLAGAACAACALLAGRHTLLVLPACLSAVAFVAFVGGLGPGLVTTIAGAIALSFTSAGDSSPTVATALAHLFCGVALATMFETLHRGRARDRMRIEQMEAGERELREALRQSEELRTALDEHASVAITDEAGLITFANDRFCAVSGYSRDELLGHDHRVIKSGHHPKEFFREMWSTLQAGNIWRGEVLNRSKNGSLHWEATTMVPFRGKEGAPRHYIAIRTDVTERRMADEEVRRQRAELQILFDLNPAMIWFKDTNNNQLRVNKRAADATGLSVSEIEGRPTSEIYPTESDRYFADDLEVIRSKQPKLGIIEKISDRRGNQLWVEMNKVPYCDADGNVLGIVVSAQDITERKRADEALRQSEERFRQLAETVREIFWIADPQSLRCLYVSPAFEKVFGRQRDLLQDPRAGWENLIHPEDRTQAREHFRRLMVEPHEQVFRVVHPDGVPRWIKDRGYPVRDASGKVYRLVGTAEDITATRRLQDQLLQAQKMEAIGTLAGGIAHDFNNILGGIIGYTELARMRTKADPATRAHLDAVLQASRRAADLVRQILAFSRRHDPRPGVVQLRHLVAEAMKLLRASIPATIEFNIDLDAEVAPIYADPTHVHQALLNLCSNAEYAMRGQAGRLGVRLHNFPVDESFAATQPRLRPGPHVRLVVSDTGRGMSPDVLERVFEPFFTTKAPGEGSGLGLSVVHGVVESHQGLVLVESSPGKGTRVELYFPAAPATTQASSGSTSPLPMIRGSGEHILFVDDEAPLAQLGEVVLQELGYRATVLRDPAEALQLLRTNAADFALVMTDQTMPGMTGVALAGAIREIRADLPVVLMTGYGVDIVFAQAKEAGIREVVSKPLELRVLAEVLRSHLPAPSAPNPLFP